MLKHFTLFFILLSTFSFEAQDLRGVVKDANNQTLIGAKLFASSGQKTLTDNNGSFRIENPNFPLTIITMYPPYLNDTLTLASWTENLTIVLKEEIQELNTVTATSNRSLQKIEEVTISMEVIKPALIDNKGMTDLEQVVDQVPGVYAMDGQVSIRGGSGFSYGAGSRVMLLWNGTPLLSADAGDAKWNAIPLEQTAQIEVLKGASSVLYGSGALNGIISLTEKEPTTKGEWKGKIQSGIYDNPKRSSLKWWTRNPMFYQGELYYGKMYQRVGFTASFQGYKTEGFRQGEIEDRLRLSGTVYFKPKKLDRLKFGVGYNVHYSKGGNFIIWQSDTLGYTPSGGADTSVAGSTLTYNKGWRISIDPYLKYISKKGNKHQLKTRFYDVINTNLNNASQSSTAKVYYADYQYQKAWKKTTVTSGATSTYNSVKSGLFGNHYSLNLAVYGQIDQKIGKLQLTGGVRIEYFEQDKHQGDTYFTINKSGKTIPVYPVFRLGAHYPITKTTHLRGSIGQGIRYPSIAERYTYTSVGALNIFPNPTLNPEKGWAAELGVKQVFPIGKWKGMLDLAGFINEYSNMMEFAFGLYNPPGTTLNFTDPNHPMYLYKWLGFKAQNAERARITGLEVSFNSIGKIKEVELVTLIGYTYMNPISLNQDSIYKLNFSDPNTNMLKYRFNHLAKADLEATYKNFSLGFSARYNSYMSNIDAIFEQGVAGTQILPGLKNYRDKNNHGNLVFDVRIGYQAWKHYRIGFMINNLLNTEYTTRPGDIQAPRTFIVQLQFKF